MKAGKDIQRYLRRTARKLYCSKATKKALLAGLGEELQDHALLRYDEICQVYGTPAQAASLMMEEMAPDEVRRQKRKRRFALAGVLASFLIVTGVLGAFAADAWSKFYQPGTTVVVTDEPQNIWVEEDDK